MTDDAPSGNAAPGSSATLANDTPASATPLRVWPAVLLVAFYWTAFVGLGLIEIPMFRAFLMRLLALAILTLAFPIWWLRNRRIPRGDRWIVFGTALVSGIAAVALSHRSVVAPSVLMFVVPVLFTVWGLWLLATRSASDRVRRAGLLLLLPLIWAPVLLIRMEGLSGDGQAVLAWRWSPSSEDRFLAARPASDTAKTPAANSSELSAEATPPAKPLTLEPGDWPQFRGPDGDAVVHGTHIARDWNASPPPLVWEKSVGPAWSSVVVIGDRLFTQEQRGQLEATLCLDTATGRELWAHEDKARFEENLSGIGPRATPAFADGRLFTLGATGLLDALDAATGKPLWSRDIRQEAGAELPMWGFSSSPLVVQGTVIAFAGGKSDGTLLAYSAATGEKLWSVSAGEHSYSSPQLVHVGDSDQILFAGNGGLVAIEPKSGETLWKHPGPDGQSQPSIQPHLSAGPRILVSYGPDFGTTLLDLSHNAANWLLAPRWTSKDLKPFFNDFVIHEKAIYGFDGNLFGCVDLETGKRRWKKGRYGNGQVLLLADEGLLIVLSESGDVVLLAANPDRLEELGRFPALSGKTCNHPVLVRDRLYVRNSEQLKSFSLAPAATKAVTLRQ